MELCGTLWNLTSGPPRTIRSPCRTSWNCGGTLLEPSWIEPSWIKPPRTTRQPSQNLVEIWRNPGETPVQPSWNLTSQNLVDPWSNPGGTLVERWWNAVWWKPWWNCGGTLVEPSWNLTSRPPRTTPEPIWAETPKLSAVGELKMRIVAEKGNQQVKRSVLIEQQHVFGDPRAATPPAHLASILLRGLEFDAPDLLPCHVPWQDIPKPQKD